MRDIYTFFAYHIAFVLGASTLAHSRSRAPIHRIDNTCERTTQKWKAKQFRYSSRGKKRHDNEFYLQIYHLDVSFFWCLFLRASFFFSPSLSSAFFLCVLFLYLFCFVCRRKQFIESHTKETPITQYVCICYHGSKRRKKRSNLKA